MDTLQQQNIEICFVSLKKKVCHHASTGSHQSAAVAIAPAFCQSCVQEHLSEDIISILFHSISQDVL